MPHGGLGHRLEDTEVAGRPAIRIVSDDAGLAATIIPGLAMLGWSLELGGVDVLGHPGGVREYVERGVVTGIPLLHPWANRLGGRRIAGLGKATVDPGSMLVSLDPHGLPIHGLHLMDEGLGSAAFLDSAVVADPAQVNCGSTERPEPAATGVSAESSSASAMSRPTAGPSATASRANVNAVRAFAPNRDWQGQ